MERGLQRNNSLVYLSQWHSLNELTKLRVSSGPNLTECTVLNFHHLFQQPFLAAARCGRIRHRRI